MSFYGRGSRFSSPGAVSDAFLADPANVKYIEGPFGSGKSTTTFHALLKAMGNQKPDPFGVRASKWFVMRKTFGDLETATFQTMMQHLPNNPEAGIKYTFGKKPKLEIDVRGADYLGQPTNILASFIGLSADSDMQIDNWRGYEFTGGWTNELSELDEKVWNMILARCDRFPSRDRGGATRPLVCADYNPPDSDHWLVNRSDGIPIEGHSFYLQPPAVIQDLQSNWVVNPEAENQMHLSPGYYKNAIINNTHNEVFLRKFFGGERIALATKAAVFADLFNADLHISTLEPEEYMPIWVGADFGNFPAAVFVQLMSNGQFRVLEELAVPDLNIDRFVEEIRARLRTTYAKCPFQSVIGDPSGQAKSWTRESMTIFQIFAGKNIRAIPANTNDIQSRLEAVRKPLRTNINSQTPSILIDRRKCQSLITGFKGEYRWKENSEGVPETKIVKNKYSHPMDALQYALMHIENVALAAGGYSSVARPRKDRYDCPSDAVFGLPGGGRDDDDQEW